MKFIIIVLFVLLMNNMNLFGQSSNLEFEKIDSVKPRNIIFIMSEDHNYKYMGFTGEIPWLETPGFDRMANEGMYFENAYLMTSLCTPSKATLLTGLNTHSHKVVNNSTTIPKDLNYFTEYLKAVGYQTSFIGSWVGDLDVQPKGFDYWVRFSGKYYNPTVNDNGKIFNYTDSTYSTDVLAEHTFKWLDLHDKNKPFYLQLNLKEAHAHFNPSRKFVNTLENVEIELPASFYTSAKPIHGKSHPKGYHSYLGKNKNIIEEPTLSDKYYGQGRVPDWQKMQRESWHGVDYMFYGKNGDIEFNIKRYGEQLLSADEFILNLINYLEEAGMSESTLIIFTTDNGFGMGEHGLIDKRHFYEESAKIPLLVRCPELIKPRQVNTKLVQNLDFAPTILDLAGVIKPSHMQGISLLPFFEGKDVAWRDHIFYEYFWEYEFPQTPTMHGIRTDQYKYIRYHGLWDTNELFDLEADPYEMNNLINSPDHQAILKELSNEIFDWLEETNGMQIPLGRHDNRYGDHRNDNKY